MTHKDHNWERDWGGSGSISQRKRGKSDPTKRNNPRTGLELTEVDILDSAGKNVCIIDVDLNPNRTVDGKSTYKAVFLDKDELGKLLNLGADLPQLVNNAINYKINLNLSGIS